jgi:hypothetical protein
MTKNHQSIKPTQNSNLKAKGKMIFTCLDTHSQNPFFFCDSVSPSISVVSCACVIGEEGRNEKKREGKGKRGSRVAGIEGQCA